MTTTAELTAADFLQGGGENGARMREIDWSQTALGPVEDWPQSLRTCIRIVLTSRQPMFVWWGEQLINLYNDAYKTIAGGKHPWALGAPASEVWREIWDQVGPRAAIAMQSNEGTYDEALLLIMERYGYPEETYYTFSYSPVPNDEGGTGGILCANTDDTQRIVGERQLALLRELAARTADTRTIEEACTRSIEALETNARDMPFALLYLVEEDRDRVTLAGSAGIDEGHPAAPGLDRVGESPWPFESVIRTQKPEIITDLTARFDHLPSGAWDRAPHQAVAVPIVLSGAVEAVLIVGLNPFRLYDDDYRRFVELVSAQVTASLGNAQAYEDERRRAESLAELDRAKTAFFSNVSHEFRTPLTLMLGPLEDMLAKPPGDVLPENRELLAVMHRNGRRLMKLVNTLLDFSRIEAGRVQATYEPTDLAAYTAELVSVFRAAIDRAGMRLIIDAPPLSQPAYVDRDMWEKIVLNLVSNAFKYTLEGEIAVTVREERNTAIVTVRDTGIGIPADEVPRLFNRFHRVEGARGRTQEGTGIGLALVQELVRLHGGAVNVESEAGTGSTFTVAIPLGTEHLPEDRIGGQRTLASTNIGARQFVEEALRWLPEADHPPEHRDDAPITSGRIILADDNADMRDYVRRLLQPFYEVIAVGDGCEALNAAIEQQPDLVLTDVMMPNLDGFGLLRELRSNRATAAIPVIMLSARAGEEARVEGLQAGADDYLVKPFSARELLARVSGMLAVTRVRHEAHQLERRLQQELEAERVVLRDIFTRAPAFIATLRGPDLVFDIANPHYMQLVGKDRQIVGKPVREALPEIEGQGFFELLDTVYRTGEPYLGHDMRVELERDGVLEERYADFVYQPIRDRDGFVTGIFVHGNDVTEQVRARQIVERQAEELERANLALMEAQESLKEADRRKDEFIATLSHELRTPLTAILGWASMLKMGGNDETTFRTAIETIDQSAKVQAQLIDDVLDVSRITSGKVRIASDRVNVVNVASSAIDTVRLAASARGVRLIVDFDPSEPLLILGDANRMQQIIWNLLSNAIKFTPEGGEVRLTAKATRSGITIQVRDTGIGIRSEFLPHVFEAFRQAESTSTRVHGGLGLGLSIVRYLVELHGGQITAESGGEGTGATFTVELPRFKARAAAPDAPLSADARDAGDDAVPQGADLRGMNLLVIDDQHAVRDFLCAVLLRSGADVRGADSVQKAVRAVEEKLPDVILCDIAMPHEDGFAFIAWMRSVRWPRRVPVLAITAFGRPDDELRVRQAGFDGYIRKPVEPEALTEAVAAARV
jgi:signal transduction histidine kinase/DNA-binding response OmpR family regulator